MTSMLVTLVTPGGRHDVEVPSDIDGRQLLASMVDRLDSGSNTTGWALSTPDGTVIDANRTLADVGVLDGSVLHLTPRGVTPLAPQPTSPVRTVDAADRARRVIPEVTPHFDRLVLVLRAVVGTERPRSAGGPIERARAAWTWTDHSTRLRWLLSRPVMRRCVTIGIVGHRSDEVAEGLADAFGDSRMERVVVVDGDTHSQRLSRRGTPDIHLEEVESGLRRRDLKSIERDRLFARLPGGALLVPTDPHRPPPDAATYRRLTESLSSHAGIVIIDCGPTDSPNAVMLDLCDQIVDTSLGHPATQAGQVILGHWERRPESSDQTFAAHQLSGDSEGLLELAVIVASGWSALDIAGPVPVGV